MRQDLAKQAPLPVAKEPMLVGLTVPVLQVRPPLGVLGPERVEVELLQALALLGQLG
jgi:hypothetical protein